MRRYRERIMGANCAFSTSDIGIGIGDVEKIRNGLSVVSMTNGLEGTSLPRLGIGRRRPIS